MIELPAAQIAQVVEGEIHADRTDSRRVVRGAVWDSRAVEEDNVFFAFPGEKADGNDYIAAAIQAGAGSVVCTREPDSSLLAIAGEFACPVIVVSDTRAAFTDLARFWRRKLHAVVVGVTGSSGKTSTKDFLRSVLSQRFKTVATAGNHNNEIGVPATVLSAGLDTEVLIVEMGMRGEGQIASLCELAHPGIGVVTNIGVSHLELLGSQDAIARAKGELFAALPKTGLAVVNVDDPYTPYLIEHSGLLSRGVKSIGFGFSEEADVRAAEPSFDFSACPSFEMSIVGQPPVQVKLALPGRHSVSDALAAAAVGKYLGLSAAEIAKGLSETKPTGMRMEVVHSRKGVTVVDDAYNANPDSMRASLATLAQMDCTGRRVAVLGDMGELGHDGRFMHEEVGRVAAKSNLDLLICVGTLSEGIRDGALWAGMEASKVEWFGTLDEAAAYLSSTLAEGDLVLVKASRFMEFERIVKGIVE